MEENEKCPICGNKLSKSDYKRSQAHVGFNLSCSSCGEIKTSGPEFPESQFPELYILAGRLRETKGEQKEFNLEEESIKKIIDSASIPAGPLEAIDRILQYVYKNSKTAASFVPLEDKDYPIAYAKDIDEFDFFKNQAVDLGYLNETPGKGPDTFRLTLKGWERIDELRKKVKESRQAFVAMWFNDDLNDAFDKGFKPALEETGYKPVRIDHVEHNEKIDDKIIAEIRKSGLLIADFTGHRGGVYFEAGFALGLGIPVVWTCREDHLQELHFDTRQYSHIVWTTPEDLKEKLRNRIEATIPIAH